MNFSITSGEQSLHVFTATLTLFPFCSINKQKETVTLMENLVLVLLLYSSIGMIHLLLFYKLHRRPPRKTPHQGFVREQCHFGRSRTSQLQNIICWLKYVRAQKQVPIIFILQKDMNTNFQQTWFGPFIENLTINIWPWKYKRKSCCFLNHDQSSPPINMLFFVR